MGHVIFGTGAVGMAVMETLVDRGEQVRMINRTGTAEVPVGVDVLGGDASDPEFARRAAAGATVVYQALNPAYKKWPELFPALQAGCWPAPRIGRASDYFGPRGGQQSNLGDRVFLPALDGKTAQVLGDPEMLHTYTHIPDIGSSRLCSGSTMTPSERCGTCPTLRRSRRASYWKSPTARPAIRCGYAPLPTSWSARSAL